MRNLRSDDPRTWKANDEPKRFMEPIDAKGGGDDGRWEDGVTLILLDLDVCPGQVLVNDVHRGERSGWVPFGHLRPAFSTPRLIDSADKRRRYQATQSTIKGIGFTAVGILESGIYKKGEHELWTRQIIGK